MKRIEGKKSGGSCADMGKLKSGRSHTHGERERLAQTCTHTRENEEPHFCAHFPTLARVPHHHQQHRGEFIDNNDVT